MVLNVQPSITSCGQIDQTQLAEDLWFLRTLRFSRAGPSPWLGRVAHERLVLSDTIALYLSTSDPDGAVAVFDMPEDNIIFLAKSGSSNSLYEDESALFFRTLISANEFEDLLPFLARRGCSKVNKRIRKLRNSLGILYDELLDAAREYEPIDAEFRGPWYKTFIRILTKDQLNTLSFKQILINTLMSCKDRLENNPPFSNTTESHRPFAELLYAASTFFYSRFFRSSGNSKPVDRLGRHLEKVLDYLDVSRLIKVWKRHGGDTRIKWITDVEQPEVPRILTTAGVGEKHLNTVYQRKVKEPTDYKPFLLSNMNRKYPDWKGEASEGTTFVPCIHAEIRLILYLMGSIKNLPLDEVIPIGCGQRSCFACSLWMAEFNRIVKMRWTTSLNNGQPRYDWAPPSTKVIVPYVGVEGYNDMTSHILEGVRSTIEGVISEELIDAVDAYLDSNAMSLTWKSLVESRYFDINTNHTV